MNLHSLYRSPSRRKRKVVGRGDGSGSGGTSGRGNKGQKARSGATIRPFFEGGQIPFFRRLPKRGFNSPYHKTYNTLNLSDIESSFSAGDTVDEETARNKGLIRRKIAGLKILGGGEIKKAVSVKANKFSSSAKSKIEAAGGKCEIVA